MEAATGKATLTIKGETAAMPSVAFSPDGSRIVTANHDGTVSVWNAKTGEKLNRLKGHSKVVSGVAFSSDGTRMATASWDGSIKIWNTQD